MTFQGINSQTIISSAREVLDKNKTISTEVRLVLELMIQLIDIMSSRLMLNSSNSSLSPSSDKVPRQTRKTVPGKKKKRSDKPVGGQTGHEGKTLEKFPEDRVDEVVELSLDRRTLPSGVKFKSDGFESRQVIDVILDFVVTEYQAEVLVDKDGNRFVADFPVHISKAVQYGSTVKALSAYLSQYQLLPYNRVQEMFENCFNLKISQGTIYNFNKEAYERLEPFEEEVKQTLKSADVVNADETGIQIGDKNHWMHVLCTPKTTYFFPHEKRGQEAMKEMSILSGFSGVLCHDHWKPYFGMTKEHSLCNAHHLRELQWVIDFKDHKWAKSMKRFLNKTNELTTEAGGVLSQEHQQKRITAYRKIIKAGRKECPIIARARGSGNKKVKQTKERNLLDRLDKFEDTVLHFMRKKNVPFTNNQAERDIRMVKVHQKVSGCFKSMTGARYFCRTRGYLLTKRKRGYSPFTVMNDIFHEEI